MKRFVCLAALLSIAAACSSSPSQETVDSKEQAVVAGAHSPDELGYPIDRFQRNATLGQLAYASQGCSGTLVGDRVVVSAAHCVVLNQDAWVQGAAPQVVPAASLKYAVGDDVHNPLCLLQAQSVHVHPQSHVNSMGAIEHDVSITILDESALESCPAVVPVQINRAPLGPDFVGQKVLQGGFGALDHTYNFSPIRYWSLLQIAAVGQDYLVYDSVQHGAPSFGDSGSGCLYRFPDGSLRNLGVDSLAGGLQGTFVRLDNQGSFFDQVLTQDLVCGAVGPLGVCRDHAAVACGPNGFTSLDCQARHEECAVDSQGKAGCVCACNTSAQCESGCECDPNCADAGAPEAGAEDANTQLEASTGSCSTKADLISQTSCGAGMACDVVDFVAGTLGCRQAGAVPAFGNCSVQSPPCVAGTTCVPLGTEDWKCLPFCDSQIDSPLCPDTGLCIVALSTAAGNIGACFVPSNCDLASISSCPSGEGCYIIDDTPNTYCFPSGSSRPNASCRDANDCMAGADCLNRKCTRWCNASTNCGSSASCEGIGTIAGHPELGHCIKSAADAGPDAEPAPDAQSPGEDAQAEASIPAPDAAIDSGEQEASAEPAPSDSDDSGGCQVSSGALVGSHSAAWLTLLGLGSVIARKRLRGRIQL